jgi:hypothetical protein
MFNPYLINYIFLDAHLSGMGCQIKFKLVTVTWKLFSHLYNYIILIILLLIKQHIWSSQLVYIVLTTSQ